MKKVLILTYYWPPAAGPGVQRILKFCKYLREFGWEPVVVTVQDGSYPATDDSLEKDVPEGLKVIRTKTREPHRMYNALRLQKGKSVPVALMGMRDSKSIPKKVSLWIRANYFIPDARKGWMKYAFQAAREIVQNEDISAVITTGPPHSTHLTGMRIQKELGVKWIADMRDPWTQVYTYKHMPFTESSKRKDHRYEQAVLNNADAISVVSHGLKDMFQAEEREIEVIYNGFDPTDLGTQSGSDSKHFVCGYIGNFKPNQNVSQFWQAIAELCEGDDSFRNDFRFEVTGNIDPFIADEIRGLGLEPNLILNGYVSHHEATAKMMASNVLLFVVPNDENNHLILTGKLFEYLGSGVPMLSVGPVKGNASLIISDCERADMLDYQDIEGMKGQLRAMYTRWKSGEGQQQLSAEPVNRYSRKNQTGKLAALLDKITT